MDPQRRLGDWRRAVRDRDEEKRLDAAKDLRDQIRHGEPEPEWKSVKEREAVRQDGLRAERAGAVTRRVKQLESLSKPALAALVKLVFTRRALRVAHPEAYEELREAGWAYYILSTAAYALAEDREVEMLAAMQLS